MTINYKKQRARLIEQINKLRPWHHDIQITEDLSTGEVFSKTRHLMPTENNGVSLISPRNYFIKSMNALFPDGLHGKRFLDCACNAGGYCFLARELGAAFSYGFDVRNHWIAQGQFVIQNRTFAPVDRIELKKIDLYDLTREDLDPFDLTHFSGIFYHLPDPITGLKIAADLTKDIIVFSTSMAPADNNTIGLTMKMESVENLMSGVYRLAWLPNNEETLKQIFTWLGFKDMKITSDRVNPSSKRRRILLFAARNKSRLDALKGARLK